MSETNNQVYYQQGGGDEQYTPQKGVEVLLPHIQHLKDKIIWCPFDKEDSQFVKVLTENGFTNEQEDEMLREIAEVKRLYDSGERKGFDTIEELHEELLK